MGGGGGGTPDFKWRGCSNGGNNQNPKESLRQSNPPPKKKNPWGFQQNPQKLHGQKLNTKKSHAVLPSLKNFQKTLNGVTCTLFGSTIFAELRGRDARALPQIFKLFWIPPKNPYLNPATATPKNTCPIFLPKKIPESKISNPKCPSIIPVTWNPNYPTTSGAYPSPGNKQVVCTLVPV